jgi:PAS domain S-box-containing protein
MREPTQNPAFALLHAGVIRTLLDAIPDLIFYKDASGVCLNCKSAFENWLGLPQDSIIGRTDRDLFGVELAETFREHDRLEVESGQSCLIEERVAGNDRRERLFETFKSAIRGDGGRPLGLLGIRRDITESRRAEEEIKTQSCLIVVVTASGAADEQDLAHAVGADGYVAKPVQRERLLAEIGRLVGVEYVFEGPPVVAEEPAELEPSALARIPIEQRQLLAQALQRGDVTAMHAVIAELAAEHAGLAERLAALVEVYDYDNLNRLLEAAKGAI